MHPSRGLSRVEREGGTGRGRDREREGKREGGKERHHQHRSRRGISRYLGPVTPTADSEVLGNSRWKARSRAGWVSRLPGGPDAEVAMNKVRWGRRGSRQLPCRNTTRLARICPDRAKAYGRRAWAPGPVSFIVPVCIACPRAMPVLAPAPLASVAEHANERTRATNGDACIGSVPRSSAFGFHPGPHSFSSLRWRG